MYAVVPAVAVLYLIFYTYQREFLFISALTGVGAFTLYFMSSNPYNVSSNRWLVPALAVLGLAALAGALTHIRRKGGLISIGKNQLRLFPANVKYRFMYACCGVVAVPALLEFLSGSAAAFYLMFVLFIFSASMGLMILGNMAKIADIQAGVANAAFLISLVAVMNALGRIIGGSVSDKIGSNNTLFIVIILQMLNMVGFIFYQNLIVLTIGFVFVGLCFGTFLALFPALTADQYGLKNYGVNYGIVYLAYGLAGVAAPVIADYFFDLQGNFVTTYIICAAIMACMIVVNVFLKRAVSRAS